MTNDLKNDALHYHRYPTPGKLAITATKPLSTQRDLALAYSPGVAEACNVIVEDQRQAAQVTARGNLVGVITNGTAVLGLGAIGALASKPVMEGKAVLFKKFAGIDVFDIEINENDPQAFIETVARLEPTFGGINLEDIKGPDCFIIEQALRERMNIPVFHDDQHGTAIIAGAAILNGLTLANKSIDQVCLVASGAGAASLACLKLLVALGMRKENITVVDSRGVIYEGRTERMDPWKAEFARQTTCRSLDEVMVGADIFLGLSGAGLVSQAMVKSMAADPLIFALANPSPEILPEEIQAVRDDAIIATGRSDYPNQVNNVLCFPYIFRGALDVGATAINETMKMACVHALADLAQEAPSDTVLKAYGKSSLRFGREYLIPKPFDPRLILRIAPAVAQAAMETGVATQPITDFDAYRERLSEAVFRSGLTMKPVFSAARSEPQRRLIYAEGEERRSLQAAQQVIDEGMAFPILVGRSAHIQQQIEHLGLSMQVGRDCQLLDISADQQRLDSYWQEYHRMVMRRGINPDEARARLLTYPSIVAAMALRQGHGDAMLCGVVGKFRRNMQMVEVLIGRRANMHRLYTLSALILEKGTFFICDTHGMDDPDVDELVELARLAAAQVEYFGIEPKIAFLSRSNFGTHDSASALRMRAAVKILQQSMPHLQVDGEMQADMALSEQARNNYLPDSRLHGCANLLIMPGVDAAHISLTLLNELEEGAVVGPMLLGAAKPVHVVNQSITVRGLVNMSAVAVAQIK